jgi:hypothetical protein
VTPLFTINFRREAYLRERERVQRRAFSLGSWVAYFGAVVLVLGLYGLNGVVLDRRLQLAESRMERMRASHVLPEQLKLGATELALVEQAVENPRRWRAKMLRLAAVLPPDAALTSVAVNPDNLSDVGNLNKLVIDGVMRSPSGQDRMGSVMRLVSALHGDSVFAAGYQSIKLVKSNMSTGADPVTEFTIECR